MRKAVSVVYRRLTQTDFFNIYKPPGTEETGGGQTYIDFPATRIPLEAWRRFFHIVLELMRGSGPGWEFQLHSIGLRAPQMSEINQRRPATFRIINQNINSAGANRVGAWLPSNGFPEPVDPTQREPPDNLVIYIVKTTNDEYWAGWFQTSALTPDWQCTDELHAIFDRRPNAGIIENLASVYLDIADTEWPFRQSE